MVAVSPLSPRKQVSRLRSISRSTVGTAFVTCLFILLGALQTLRGSVNDVAEYSLTPLPPPLTQLPDEQGNKNATISKVSTKESPAPSVRPDTGAFQNCQGPVREDRFYFPTLHDHSIIVSCHKLHYKLPPVLNRNRYFVNVADLKVPVNLVIGILSSVGAKARRDAIRRTWAANVFNRYFVVGGNDFERIRKEFTRYQDMIWVDREESYEDVLYKSGLMLAIFQRHIKGFHYVLKTDDDTYINVPVLHAELSEGGEGYQQEYYGHCHVNRTIPYRPFQRDRLPPYFKKFIVNKTIYPEKWNAPYCQGAGYILGGSFLKCILREIPTIRYHPFEDVAMGLMAERCGITAVRHSTVMDYKWHFQVGDANLTGKILQHPVETPEDMKARHKTVTG